MIVTLTPLPDFAPVPRVEVRIADAISWNGGDAFTTGPDVLDGGDAMTDASGFDGGNAFTTVIEVPADATAISLHRVAAGRTMKVRGALSRTFNGGFAVLDYEAPFESAQYLADFLTPTGVVRVPLGSVILPWTGPEASVVVQQPLDPHLNAAVRNLSGSWLTLTRPADGDLVRPQGAAYPSLIASGPRHAAVDVAIDFEVVDRSTAARVWATLGDESAPQLPAWLVRAPNRGLLPPVFFCEVLGLAESDITVAEYAAGNAPESISRFKAQVSEIAPPAPGLVIAALSYDDLDVSFPDYDMRDAAFPSYNDMDSAWEYAGAAG